MNEYKLSELIRQLRIEKGLTQEKLAEGICSPVTISRIENGTQIPSDKVLGLLLDRLGDDLFHTLGTTVLRTNAREMKKKEKEIIHYIASGQIKEAESLLLEANEEAVSTPAQQQRVKYMEALLFQQNGGDNKEIQGLLESALLLTKPKFDRNDFRNIILTSQEMQIINFLSIVLWEQAEYRQAIRISFELSDSMERKKSVMLEQRQLYVCVLTNQIQFLESEKRYEEAYEICTKAEQICRDIDYMSLFPELLFSKAKLLFFLGKRKDCITIIKGIYPYLLLIQKNAVAEKVRSFASKTLRIELSEGL